MVFARIQVLGPITIDPEPAAALGGPRQRRLLAALVLHRNHVVSTDRLVDIVFGANPTAAAATTLRSYVARLRRSLDGTGASLVTQAPGYFLDVGPVEVDAELFEQAVVESRSDRSEGHPTEALDRVTAGLALWRGPAYDEFADEEWVQPEVVRLEELRLQAEEIRIGCLLDLGRHVEALPEATSLVERHELRDEARILQLTALYRSGRQADALRAAGAYRERLVDIGLEPGDAFAALENRILLQDPALRLPPPAGRLLRGYRLGERLRGGDDWVTHRALQPGFERIVAITSFGGSIADHPDFIREFEPRVQVVASIEHPGLVDILDFWREPGSAHVVTRMARGGGLPDLLDKGPLPAETVARVIGELAAALTEVHRHGLWHGNLTPDDVLLDSDGSVRLVGVATAELVESIRDTGRSRMPVEPGPVRDQLSLAALTHRALTGVEPPTDSMDLGRLPRISDIRPELLALDAVIARAGAVNHRDRYADVAAFARSFADAMGVASPVPGHDAKVNPYKGLRAFAEADRAVFHGREELTGELIERLSANRLVVVVGASGSGKSSVVRAGVIPALRTADAVNGRLIATMVPGSSPASGLRDALNRVVPLDRGAVIDTVADDVHDMLRGAAGSAPLLLVIDQLEELYTTVDDELVRGAFIDGLMDAVEDEQLDLRILATLRADFFGHPLQHHRFGAALSEGAVAIPAMTPAQLERAIVEPARSVDVELDPPVTAELIADVVDQPAALPVLQFALTELFEARRGSRINSADHDRLGGVSGAIARRAERLFDQTPPDERELVRLLFLRLVTVKEGAGARRRVDRSELIGSAPDGRAMQRVVDRFGRARLLTFDHNPTSREPTVEVAHEALLRHWPRLRAWIDEEGRDLALRSHLTGAARDWEASGREAGELYRGSRLVDVEDWVDRADLTAIEQAFLRASLDQRTTEIDVERERLAQQVRSNRRLRRMLAALAVVLAVALVAGFTAVVQRNRARSETERAEEARARGLAANAQEQLGRDRSLALLLAVEAAAVDPSEFTRNALLGALAGDDEPFTRTVIPTPAGDYGALVLAADGRTALAKRSDGSVDIVDLVTREVTAAGLPGPAAPVAGLDVSSDGQLFVSSGSLFEDSAAIVYRVGDGEEVARIPGRPSGGISQAVFVPDTTDVLIGGAGGILELRNGLTGELRQTIDTGTGDEVTALTMLDRTAYIVHTPTLDGSSPWFVSAWSLDGDGLLAGPVSIDDGSFGAQIVADDDMVVAVSRSINAFETGTLSPIATFGEDLGGGGFSGLARSPDGLVAAGSHTDLEVWVVPGDGDPFELPVSGQGPGLAFTPDGSTLVTADPDGSISTWRLGWIEDLGEPLVPEGPGLVTLSPAGDRLAVWARNRGVQLFDPSTNRHLGELEGLGPEDSFLGLDFSPDGSSIATLTCPAEQEGPCDSVLALHDAGSGKRLAGPIDAGPVFFQVISGVEFLPDGSGVVTPGSGPEVVIRDVPTLDVRGVPLDLTDVSPAAGLQTIAVTAGERDGQVLVAALGDFGPAVVWDITGEPSPVGAIESPTNGIWFGPDGRLFVGSVNGPVTIHEPLTLEPDGAPFSLDEPAMRFAMAESGVLAISSGVGGTTLWDVETRQPLSGDLPSFVSGIDTAGQRLYLGAIGWDAGGVRVAVLPLEIDSLVADACLRAGRNLTFDEWRRFMPADSPHRATCPQWPLPVVP